MIDECDLVALLIDRPDLGLVRGDVGTVAMVHGRGEGFEHGRGEGFEKRVRKRW